MPDAMVELLVNQVVASLPGEVIEVTLCALVGRQHQKGLTRLHAVERLLSFQNGQWAVQALSVNGYVCMVCSFV
jgi:hypothetical protein